MSYIDLCTTVMLINTCDLTIKSTLICHIKPAVVINYIILEIHSEQTWLKSSTKTIAPWNTHDTSRISAVLIGFINFRPPNYWWPKIYHSPITVPTLFVSWLFLVNLVQGYIELTAVCCQIKTGQNVILTVYANISRIRSSVMHTKKYWPRSRAEMQQLH